MSAEPSHSIAIRIVADYGQFFVYDPERCADALMDRGRNVLEEARSDSMESRRYVGTAAGLAASGRVLRRERSQLIAFTWSWDREQLRRPLPEHETDGTRFPCPPVTVEFTLRRAGGRTVVDLTLPARPRSRSPRTWGSCGPTTCAGSAAACRRSRPVSIPGCSGGQGRLCSRMNAESLLALVRQAPRLRQTNVLTAAEAPRKFA